MADRPDFTDFVTVRWSALLRSAYLLTGNWATAEDLLQTTLAKCWRSWSRMSDHPEPYVRKAMVNTYLSWRRRRWDRESPTSDLPDRAVSDLTDDVDQREVLWLALRKLPRQQRAVIVLRYFDDLTEQEAGEMLGVSRGTVKSHTSRALRTLRVDPQLVLDFPMDEEGVRVHGAD